MNVLTYCLYMTGLMAVWYGMRLFGTENAQSNSRLVAAYQKKIPLISFYGNSSVEKGKLLVREGRKATGLVTEVAGLPIPTRAT